MTWGTKGATKSAATKITKSKIETQIAKLTKLEYKSALASIFFEALASFESLISYKLTLYSQHTSD